jgi:hypothetical protein
MLKIKNVSKKHWFDMLGWGILKIMHIVLLETTKSTFFIAILIAISAYEVTKIDNTQWISIHLYVV